jgi:ribosomal protein S18 acetylase RimI-like enzyme
MTTAIRIVDVTDEPTFRLIPPCADPGFDHRSCDYWEDGDRGSKAARLAWLEPAARTPTAKPSLAGNPFARVDDEPPVNPFAPAGRSKPAFNPFADDDDGPDVNPFAPTPPARPRVSTDAPRKLALLGRGLAIFGSYAKVLLADDVPAAYAQFGPLSAYPRAQRLRELYPQLPDAPLPAVITCIAATAEARGVGHAAALVRAVCDDLAGRGFAAVEAYPERNTRPDATSAATPEFWLAAGFRLAVDDERFPVVRRELA